VFVEIIILTLGPPNKFSSAKFLFCFKFQSASKLAEMLSKCYSASHPDPSCLHNYGTVVLLAGLRVNTSNKAPYFDLKSL